MNGKHTPNSTPLNPKPQKPFPIVFSDCCKNHVGISAADLQVVGVGKNGTVLSQNRGP